MARFARIGTSVIALCLVLVATASAQPQWVNIGLEGETVHDLCLDPFEQTTIFAACASGLYRYDEFVMSWEPLSATPVMVIAASPAEQDLLYAAGENWVARSEDGGDSWTTLWTQAGLRVLKLTPHPASPDTVYLRRVGGVWRSGDRGDTWTQVWLDETENNTPALETISVRPSSIYTMTADSVYASDDNGDTWYALEDLDGWGFEYPLRDLTGSEWELAVASSGYPTRWSSLHDVWQWREFYWIWPTPDDWEGTVKFIVPFRGEGLLVTTEEMVQLSDLSIPGPLDEATPFYDPSILTCGIPGWNGAVDCLLGTVGDGVWYCEAAVYIGVEETASETVPETFGLHSVYPNPFNASTRITLAVGGVRDVTVTVYDVLGQQVATLHRGTLTAGRHSFVWDAGVAASGVYFVRAEARSGQTAMAKVMLLR